MIPTAHVPPVTICILTFGDHLPLPRRALESIEQHTNRKLCRLVVGANAVGAGTRQYLQESRERGRIDHLVLSDLNLGKCPMMRRMLEHVRSEFIWWFDDDSYITSPEALTGRLSIARAAPLDVVMWGEQYFCESSSAFCFDDPVAFVRSAPWYRGLPPPFWEPGGKGEFDFRNEGTGDGRWFFILGGAWFARASSLSSLDWPDPRLCTFGEDVFLGEAVRQQGWRIQHVGKLGVETNAAPRRWSVEEERVRQCNARS